MNNDLDEDFEEFKSRLISRNTARCMVFLETINEPPNIRTIVRSHFRSCRDYEEVLNVKSLPILTELGASEKAIEQFEYCKDLLLSQLEEYKSGSYGNV